MRSEFETLEQYQDSMKKFNENTRMGFEKFIQSHGSDRNKLQLRCTPYTSKKGGYGSFDLDFGLSVYQHQQSKVDALTLQVAEMKSRLNDAYTDGQSAMYAARQSKVDELQKRVDAAQKLIDDWNCGGVHIFDLLDELEQALKGGGE